MSALKGVAATRPEELGVAKELRICHWGTLATFVCTPEQLLGAGFAHASMFENLGKTGVKTAPDGYGRGPDRPISTRASLS